MVAGWRFLVLAGWVAGFSLAGLALAQKSAPPPAAPPPKPVAAAPKPAQIDRNGVLILIRATLSAVDNANKTGNYTVLRDMGAPGFQNTNNAARLGDIFAAHRRENYDLSGVLVLEPQLTLLPQIEANGMMHLAGFFPSVPLQVNFELLFEPVRSQWRIFGVSVNLGPSGPVAPSPAPVPVPAPAPDVKPEMKK